MLDLDAILKEVGEIQGRADKNITITFKDYDTVEEAVKRNRGQIAAARELISTDVPHLCSPVEQLVARARELEEKK